MGAERKWMFTLFSATFLSLFLLLVFSISAFSSPKPLPSIILRGPHHPPAFAYYISGGRGQKDRILRLLLAVYHPRNRYLLHLGKEASDDERSRLAAAVEAVPAIRSFGNVDVVGNPDPFTYMGSSNIAATLRAAAILLKVDSGWDWFITLSAFDYPLITQDGKRFRRKYPVLFVCALRLGNMLDFVIKLFFFGQYVKELLLASLLSVIPWY